MQKSPVFRRLSVVSLCARGNSTPGERIILASFIGLGDLLSEFHSLRESYS